MKNSTKTNSAVSSVQNPVQKLRILPAGVNVKNFFAQNPSIDCVLADGLRVFRTNSVNPATYLINFKERKIDISGFLAKMDAQTAQAALENPEATEIESESDEPRERREIKTASLNKIGKKRGRKSGGSKITFPSGEWTVEQVAKLNNVEKSAVANEMTRLKKLNEKFEIVKKIHKKGKKGRATNLYKLK